MSNIDAQIRKDCSNRISELLSSGLNYREITGILSEEFGSGVILEHLLLSIIHEFLLKQEDTIDSAIAQDGLNDWHPIKVLMSEFEGLLVKYSGYGAEDSEPDRIWQNIIAKVVAGEHVSYPVTIEDWELYSYAPDTVATELTGKLLQICQFIIRIREQSKFGAYTEMITYMQNHCHRVNIMELICQET